MLKVYHSNRLERLLAGLVDHLADPLSDPLAPEVVVVQSQGMARWLSLELAKGQGIAANLDFPFLSVCVWRLFHAVLPGLPERPAFDRASLVWGLLPLLPAVRSEPGFEAIDRYLEDGNEHKCYQLARRIAELFDQYLVYRPDWIRSWGQGRSTAVGTEQAWQPRLWRLLCTAAGRSTQAQAPVESRPAGACRGNGAELVLPQLLARFLERLRDPGLDLSVLPERISLFGLSALAPAYLQVFEALSHRIEVHLYLLNPCLAYWGDVVSRQDMARLRTQRKRHSRSMAVAAYCTVGNPLLASMGKLGRDFQEELADYDCDDREWFEEPSRDELLGWLQADILYLIDRSEPPPQNDESSLRLFQDPDDRHPRISIRDDDWSIEVHSCHSPLRELEVLHDRLLDRFDGDPSLQPGDVLVIAPDIDVYAPLVEAVIGAAPEERRIPYAIADRTAPREHPVIRCLIKLLDLPRSRLTASEVLGLLDTPPVAERFGLDQTGLALIRRWVDAAGVRWGRDAADRAALGLPGFDANSWRAGMDRLLLGFALPEAERVFAGIAPLAAVQGQETETLGALQGFIAALAQARATLAQPRTVTTWVATIQGMIETFFAEGGPPPMPVSVPLSLVRAALADIQVSAAGCEQAVGSRVLVEELEQRLCGRDTGRNFLTGRLTFANLVPMRSVPFRVICLLGANNLDFPRRERAPGFDLMAAKPRLGDRSRRDDDRYLFLETLISARDCLYLSYVGRSQRDNSQAQPSVLVSELLDLIDAGFATADGGPPSVRLVREHSLQPFDRRNFVAEGPHPPSHAAEWLPGIRALAADPLGQALPPFIAQPLPLPPDGAREVDLDELVRFLRHPTRYFFHRRLGIGLEAAAVAIADTEVFDLAPLARHELRQDLLERRLADEAGNHHYDYLAAAGHLPVGAFGALAYEEADAAVQGLAERLGRLAGDCSDGKGVGNQATLEVDLRMQNLRLTGWLRSLTSAGLVSYRAAKLTAADRLSLWVLHLVLNVLAPAGCPARSRHLALDRDLEFPPLADAAERLSRLLAAYREGLRRPLKFYPEASLAYVEQIARGEHPERALQAARRVWSAKGDGAEAASPYYRMLYRRREEPFDARFEALATELAGPVVALGRLRTPEGC